MTCTRECIPVGPVGFVAAFNIFDHGVLLDQVGGQRLYFAVVLFLPDKLDSDGESGRHMSSSPATNMWGASGIYLVLHVV